jgi:hypothetical protein
VALPKARALGKERVYSIFPVLFAFWAAVEALSCIHGAESTAAEVALELILNRERAA